MKTLEELFEIAQEKITFPEEDDGFFIRYLEILSSTLTESIYVIDMATNWFCYVSPNDLFLCGHTVEDALLCGNDFYKKIVLPDDLPLWEKIFKAVLGYLSDFDENRAEIDYFSCTFRLQRKYSFSSLRTLPQMVYHRIKPIFGNDNLRYLVCSVRSSACKKTGNLRLYCKNGMSYEEYNTATRRWKRKTIEPLTERERAILMLAQQGKSSGEIANYLCKGRNTIRNQIKPLFSKLNVHSMQEAVDFAGYHRLIYPKQDIEMQPAEKRCKRNRVLLKEDMLQHIQQQLDIGKSIRQAAKLEGIAESAIRYWIKKGKLYRSTLTD